MSWRDGVRYVEDGVVTTTAGVTSGVVGALRLVELLAGGAGAERVGRGVAYPGWRAGVGMPAGVTAVTRRLRRR